MVGFTIGLYYTSPIFSRTSLRSLVDWSDSGLCYYVSMDSEPIGNQREIIRSPKSLETVGVTGPDPKKALRILEEVIPGKAKNVARELQQAHRTLHDRTLHEANLDAKARLKDKEDQLFLESQILRVATQLTHEQNAGATKVAEQVEGILKDLESDSKDAAINTVQGQEIVPFDLHQFPLENDTNVKTIKLAHTETNAFPVARVINAAKDLANRLDKEASRTSNN